MRWPPGRVACFPCLIVAVSCTVKPVDILGAEHSQPQERFLLQLNRPLATPGHCNDLCLLPQTGVTEIANGSLTFVSRDGVRFVPSIALIGANGHRDAYRDTSELHNQDGIWLCFSTTTATLNSPYDRIEIVSPAHLGIEAARWYSYDK